MPHNAPLTACPACTAPLVAPPETDLCPSCQTRADLIDEAADGIAYSLRATLSTAAREWAARGLSKAELQQAAEAAALDFAPDMLAAQLARFD